MTMQEAEGARVIIGELLKRIAFADRLAEATEALLRSCGTYRVPGSGDHQGYSQVAAQNADVALAAYRNGGDRPPGDSPDEQPGCGAAGGGDW